jgi:phosphate transport system substrate-binding protein
VIRKQIALAVALGMASITAQAAASRDYISIVGSSTVYPFATVVAENFGKTTKFSTPKVESTGSGGGLKLFCAGVGVEHPDITNASRAIKDSEVKNCAKNGVNEIIEMKIGYDGIVMANSAAATHYELSLKDVFLALAKLVPGPDGKLIDNPNKSWKDVNADLPDVSIEVLGPPPTSGTRDAFVELAMEGGAKAFGDLKTLRGLKRGSDELKAMMEKLGIPMSVWTGYEKKKGKAPSGKDIFKVVAHGVREDGHYIEAGENDNLIVQKLEKNPAALGIFGFSFLDQNSDKVQAAHINGLQPTFEAIADGSYPVSRSLYFYVKKAHVGTIPGIQEYLNEFSSEKAWGDMGYLTDRGLIPMPKAERMKYRADAIELNPMGK